MSRFTFGCRINSNGGRVFRMMAGLFFIVIGLSLHSTLGTVLALWGPVPLSAGLFDVCYLAPILGIPFRGSKTRALCAARARS